MKVKIRDNGHSFTYENMNWLKAENGVLTINYQDENDEECEEFGDVPDYISFGDVPQSKVTYKTVTGKGKRNENHLQRSGY